jgi:hypothetical protein
MYRIVTEKGKRKYYWTGTMNLSVRDIWAIEFITKDEAKKQVKELGKKYKVEKI